MHQKDDFVHAVGITCCIHSNEVCCELAPKVVLRIQRLPANMQDHITNRACTCKVWVQDSAEMICSHADKCKSEKVLLVPAGTKHPGPHTIWLYLRSFTNLASALPRCIINNSCSCVSSADPSEQTPSQSSRDQAGPFSWYT